MEDLERTDLQESKLAERDWQEELESLNAMNYYMKVLHNQPSNRRNIVDKGFCDARLNDYEFRLLYGYELQLRKEKK